MTTEEGNKLIAEFMGFKIWYKDGNKVHVETSPEMVKPINEWAKYHSSWDWQVPAYSKLVKLSNVRALTKGYAINHNLFIDKYLDAVCDNNPEEGQKILVEFIKWYNQNLKP